jgi:hypothetical protein
MKNILTIAATIGLLSAFASSVQAQTIVTVGGAVTPSCIIASASLGGALLQDTQPASVLATSPSSPGSVTVKCNSSTSKLTLSAGPHDIPSQTPAPAVAFQFTSGGTGIYSTVTSGLVTPTATDVTSSLGDTAKFSASVTAFTGKLLKVGGYTLYINAAVTP